MIKNLGNDLSKAYPVNSLPPSILKFESPEDKLLRENRSLQYCNARLVRAMKEIRELGTSYNDDDSCTLSREARVAEKTIIELGY